MVRMWSSRRASMASPSADCTGYRSTPWLATPPMIRAAARAGFVPEGRLRRAAWVNGDFADEVILGMLATDWAGGGNRQSDEAEIPGS